jgi:hypothetical protein
MKQTAVEWLASNLDIVWEEKTIDLVEQAKEIEKQQIKDAYWASYKEGQYSGDKTADEYYNETYNK